MAFTNAVLEQEGRMYPLEAIYGPKAHRAFHRVRKFKWSLTPTCQSARQVAKDEPLVARTYADLVSIVSFLSVMNKRHSLHFRGQGEDWPLKPTMFRSTWVSPSKRRHEIPNDPEARQRIWLHLNEDISTIVHRVCDKLPMPRRATLKMFREAVWAVAQHYDLWPTPLIDITPNLRIAASFALWSAQGRGLIYVTAMPPSTNSVTYDADQHVVLARLQAVCPPVAKRPHYQDGFLVGRFPFAGPNPNQIDRDPPNVSDLSRRLVAKIKLVDGAGDGVRESKGRSGFWTKDFPRMSARSLMPTADDDKLLERFCPYADEIDDAMDRICRG
jgi:hypothetical protein